MRANDKITTTTRWTAHIGCALLVSVALASAAQAGQFGTRCQESFEDDWQSNASWGYEICGGFNGELDDSDTRDFYYNLHPSTCGFSYCDSSSALGGVDTVDLFYVATHGGTDASDALLAMWQEDSIERSSDWRYGDDNDEVGIYSQYACEVMENTDSAIWTRWGSAFRGGVYIVTGSHDKVYGSITTDEVGRDYADSLQKSKSVRRAWFDGNSDWFHDQDLAVMAVGSSSTNCTNRLNGIKWQNFTSYARLRDSEITHWCRSRITG
jgi:hypothetical protein